MNIEKTETVELFNLLKREGFEAKLVKTYANDYNQDYGYLAVFVDNAENRLEEFFELTREFEVILSKFTQKKKPFFQVRQPRVFADLVKIDGMNYDLALLRETTPTDNCSIAEYQDWLDYYNNFLKK